MTAENQNDSFYVKNTRIFAFTIMDNDTLDSNGQPVPLVLTDYTIQWALSQYEATGVYNRLPVLKKDNAGIGGVVITDEDNGKVEVRLTPSDTNLDPGLYHHELELTDTSGGAVVVATGDITLKKNIKNT